MTATRALITGAACACVMLVVACARADVVRPAPRDAAAAPPVTAAKVERVTLPGVDGVIFPPAIAEAQLGKIHEGPYWQPTRKDVEAIEAKLAAQLRAAPPPASPKLADKLERYKRQYVGAHLRGKRVLFIYLRCEVKPDWQEQIRLVKDGGDCYVTVAFDVAAGKPAYVQVNGKA